MKKRVARWMATVPLLGLAFGAVGCNSFSLSPDIRRLYVVSKVTCEGQRGFVDTIVESRKVKSEKDNYPKIIQNGNEVAYIAPLRHANEKYHHEKIGQVLLDQECGPGFKANLTSPLSPIQGVVPKEKLASIKMEINCNNIEEFKNRLKVAENTQPYELPMIGRTPSNKLKIVIETPKYANKLKRQDMERLAEKEVVISMADYFCKKGKLRSL